MRLADVLEAARAEMQEEVSRRVGRGVRVLLINEKGNFTGLAFLTKHIEVKAAVARGEQVVYVASAMPIADEAAPVFLDFVALEDVQVGFKLVAEHGNSWEVRTEEFLTPYCKEQLGIR